MYKLSEAERLKIISEASKVSYPDGAVGIEIEKMIASSLPPVPGLVRGLSAEERNEVFTAAVQMQHERFIKENGDAWGCVPT